MPGSRRSPFPFDCVLHGSGLMLTDDGGAAWRERRLEALPPPISGPARAYAQFPSEHEAAWTNDDLTGGYGAGAAPAESGRRYAHGFVDARIPNQIILPPAVAEARTAASGTVRDHFELNGVLYALIGSAVYRSTDGARWTLAHRFGDGVEAVSAAVFQGEAAVPHAFVAVGSGSGDGPYWTFDGEAWTEHPGELVAPIAVLATADGGATYTDHTAAVAGSDPAAPGELRLPGTTASGDWLLVGGRRAVRRLAAGPAQPRQPARRGARGRVLDGRLLDGRQRSGRRHQRLGRGAGARGRGLVHRTGRMAPLAHRRRSGVLGAVLGGLRAGLRRAAVQHCRAPAAQGRPIPGDRA